MAPRSRERLQPRGHHQAVGRKDRKVGQAEEWAVHRAMVAATSSRC
jgi:hypothetical protein